MIELELVIHQPSRLRIMAALAAIPARDGMDFVSLKEVAGLTDGNLSSHLSVLEEAGYVSIDKGYEGKKPRTLIRVTSKGSEAFSRYVNELENIIRGPDIPAS